MYIGIDIGGTTINGILTNEDGSIINFIKRPTRKNVDEMDHEILNLIECLSHSKSIHKNKIKAIGIGAAGSIDKKKGIVITSPNIQAWNKYPIVKKITKGAGIKVYLENDATAALIGEWWKGRGKDYENWILLTLGTGIGGGAIINNQLYTGKSGSSMEFGHMSINYNGRTCPCGNRGCFEIYASATAVKRFIKRELNKYSGSSINTRIQEEKLTSKLVYDEAIKGDEMGNKVFYKVATFLGIGISNLVNIFNPEAVILGGGLSKAHRLLLPVIKNVVNERALAGFKENIKYLVVKNEDKLSALGAAKVAIDNHRI